jgi:hypothetical protein
MVALQLGVERFYLGFQPGNLVVERPRTVGNQVRLSS